MEARLMCRETTGCSHGARCPLPGARMTLREAWLYANQQPAKAPVRYGCALFCVDKHGRPLAYTDIYRFAFFLKDQLVNAVPPGFFWLSFQRCLLGKMSELFFFLQRLFPSCKKVYFRTWVSDGVLYRAAFAPLIPDRCPLSGTRPPQTLCSTTGRLSCTHTHTHKQMERLLFMVEQRRWWCW